MISDAELTAWYGSGLHPEKAMALIDEVRRLRAQLRDFKDEGLACLCGEGYICLNCRYLESR